jgi:hypothetical protein
MTENHNYLVLLPANILEDSSGEKADIISTP